MGYDLVKGSHHHQQQERNRDKSHQVTNSLLESEKKITMRYYGSTTTIILLATLTRLLFVSVHVVGWRLWPAPVGRSGRGRGTKKVGGDGA